MKTPPDVAKKGIVTDPIYPTDSLNASVDSLVKGSEVNNENHVGNVGYTGINAVEAGHGGDPMSVLGGPLAELAYVHHDVDAQPGHG